MAAQSHSIPPKIKTGTFPLGVFAGIVLGFAILGAAAVVFLFDPSSSGFYPICPFHQMTGLNCPGCGGTRAVYALLHGHIQAALRDNALFILLLPAVALRGAWLAAKKFSGRPAGQFFPAKFMWVLLAITVVFTVLRNLPAFAILSP